MPIVYAWGLIILSIMSGYSDDSISWAVCIISANLWLIQARRERLNR